MENDAELKEKGAYKGKKHKYQGKGKEKRFSGRMNDWTWYANDSNLLRDATNLSFNNAVGGYLPDETYVYDAAGNHAIDNLTIPGILTMVYVPTVGISKDFNSPINVAKAKLYTFVRHANSGHANYDSPDLMQYVMSKTSIDALFWHFARVYACAFKYHQTNRYLPKALIEAMGIDADDIVANLADFRAQLNIAAVKLNALFIPNTFGYYKRQSWLNTQLIFDSVSPKAQIYVPVPYCAWVYNESGADVGNLTPKVVYNPTNAKLKFTDIVTILNDLINPLVASEDVNIMSGDMLKAYGEEKRVVLPTLAENYDIPFNYSEEVLEQVHNTTFVGEFYDGYTPKILQDPTTGLITFDPQINADNYVTTDYATSYIFEDGSFKFIESRKRLDLITNDATPERIIVASRNTAMFSKLAHSGQEGSKIDSCGSELFLYGDIYVNSSEFHSSSDAILYSKGLARYRIRYINSWAPVRGDSDVYFHMINAISKFDWFPICYFYQIYINEAKGENEFGSLCDPNDINNYTVIHRSNLAKLHELALLTQFNITNA